MFWEIFPAFISEPYITPFDLSKNLKIKIFRTIILPFIVYRHETWCLSRGRSETEGIIYY